EERLLRAALVAERHGSHPIAEAIRRYGKERGIVDVVDIAPDSEEFPGKGMTAWRDGVCFCAGTKSFLEENGVALADAKMPEQPGALVYIARNRQFLGLILVTDSIKAEAAPTIASLKKLGLATFMLSGDHEKAAAWVAKECGIGGFRAGLLPEEKVAALQEISPAHAAFVGDGINDAPVLALSRVGIAMGGIGAAAAIEAADAVIMGDSPAQVARLFRLAQNVRANVYQNIALALSAKAVVMVLGIAGISGLWEAVFADVGVALLAVLNASRLMRQ
ncbi:MAG TPA: heavy metal translocating P-type ATPase, partial [Desulfobulbaceae bacterium]|nr:heavy metal translocating P-type ATPase [Desulfobulbaceae bacterium]